MGDSQPLDYEPDEDAQGAQLKEFVPANLCGKDEMSQMLSDVKQKKSEYNIAARSAFTVILLQKNIYARLPMGVADFLKVQAINCDLAEFMKMLDPTFIVTNAYAMKLAGQVFIFFFLCLSFFHLTVAHTSLRRGGSWRSRDMLPNFSDFMVLPLSSKGCSQCVTLQAETFS